MRRTTPLLALVAILTIATSAACTSSGGDSSESTTTTRKPVGSTTTPPPTTGTTRAQPATGAPARLQFRPVIGSQPCSSVHPDSYYDDETASGDIPATTLAPNGKPQLLEDVDGKVCYGVGPVGGDGTDLDAADAAQGSTGDWQVSVHTKTSSVAKLDRLFNDCYQGTSGCPGSSNTDGQFAGALAIVLDGKVISAPQVNGPDLASDTFEITANFSEAEAKALAEMLNS